MQHERAVVADPSSVVVRLLARFLAERGMKVASASDGDTLWNLIDAGPPVDLVVADAQLPLLPGLELLEKLRPFSARPNVVLTSRVPTRQEEDQALLAGVLGYLPKPIRLPDLARAIALGPDADAPSCAAPRARPTPVATVRLLDQGEAFHACEAVNISETGALLATLPFTGPIRVLDLEVVLGGETFRCGARIVRIQQPSWHGPSGIAVEFDTPPSALARAVRQLLDDCPSGG